MSDGGILSIRIEDKENYLLLSISDDGQGIEMKDIGNLSQPFFTTKVDGTGLGLVIIERILRDHGAEFGIETVAGKGTVFSIQFPLKDKRTRLLESAVVDVETITKEEFPNK